MKKLLLIILLSVASPTFLLAHLLKNNILNKGALQREKTIEYLNWIYLGLSAVIVGVCWKWPNYCKSSHYLIFLYWLIISRATEIFTAFCFDANDKLCHKESTSNLSPHDRLGLAFRSYFELVLGFGNLYFLLPSVAFHFSDGRKSAAFRDIFEAIYFSGVTITTIGYGDITPTKVYSQLLVLAQVFCGLILALVSFTIYVTEALKDKKNQG